MVGGGTLRGSVRWAFNIKTWDPTEQEWLLALRCISLEDKERVNKFVFKLDAKACIVGCLMSRKLACQATGESNSKVVIEREKHGRPFFSSSSAKINFNVSHQGSYTVLAGEVGNNCTVGVDVMSFTRKTGSETSEFFRLMNKTCSVDEWNTILASNSDEERLCQFFRHWCLKESYLKGIGSGVRTDMRHISFRPTTRKLSTITPTIDTILEIDRLRCSSWVFHEWLLDCHHCVSVALSSDSNVAPCIDPVPFTFVSWVDLIEDLQPFQPPDEPCAQIFMKKEESGRSHEGRCIL